MKYNFIAQILLILLSFRVISQGNIILILNKILIIDFK